MNALATETALPAIASTLQELPFGSHSQVRTREGQLAVFLAFAEYDRRNGAIKYALRVMNNTPVPAYARLFVENAGVQAVAYPRDIVAAPFSMRDDMIPVRTDFTGPFDRAIVAVKSGENYVTAEAPPPPRAPRTWMRWCALGAVPLFVIAASQAGTPRVLGLWAPHRAIAGTTVRIPYQLSGVGTAEYDVQTRDGLQLAAGLADRSGVLTLRIPNDGAGSPYRLHLRMRNAFSSAQAGASIAAVVPQGRKAARAPSAGAIIANLSVMPSPAFAGKDLSVRYATRAASGDVWLLDASGAAWAHEPLSLAGETRLPVPQAAAGQDMRVVLHAVRGTENAQSSVGITVLPSQTASAPRKAAAPAPKPSHEPASLNLSSQVVSAGEVVTARVTGVSGDVRVTLLGANGAQLAEGDVQGNGGITLTAPEVTAPTTFYVVATLTSGVGQQSLIKHLVVTPR